ncbi:MAG TPA: dephospho-CoA kinase [Actinomycetota bacterium]|nr:dephospho-CoA kinase [Actinomycetota bacterium]
MPVIGLAGGIASGKSTVGELLRRKGALVIDADAVAHEIVEPGRPALAEIRDRFGNEVITPDGWLDRAALGRVVFDDPQARSDLNDIMHPRIYEEIQRRIRGQRRDRIMVFEAALLAETYEQALEWLEIDAVVVVDAPPEVQVQRLVDERDMTLDEAHARISSQTSRQERNAHANYVIRNVGTLADLEREVDRMWAQIQVVDPDRPLFAGAGN